MRVLLIHSDYLEYEAKEAIKNLAEEISEEKKKGKIEEAVVAFMTVEKEDDKNPEEVANNAVKTIKEMAEKVNCKNVVIYPYAHLSSDLAPPGIAKALPIVIESKLKDEGFNVLRSPFGWYKSFRISCKGHPLSELSREITAEKVGGEVSKAVEAEKKAVSSWHILDMDGKLHPLFLEENAVKGYDFKYDNLRLFAQYEMAKSRIAGEEPPHVELMRRLELVDYEPGSDPGNFRYYPKGRLIKSLLERFVTEKVKETGGMEVETPIMYDFNHPSLKSYLDRFPARQYTVQTPDKKVFLRFAACFGQFLIMHDAKISYRNLPLRLYELTRYSFRVEQRGELAGLRRLRTFTMPDCHSFCADMEMAKSEIISRFELSKEVLGGAGLNLPDDLEFAIRVTKDFYEKNREFIVGLVKRWGKPALIEMWDERFFYFVFKYEWNFVDSLEKASALCTDQIDVENAERYGITYTGSDGKEHHPYILHQSPSGAIERVIYAILERAHMKTQKHERPELPLWLAPTQIRLIPVSENFIEDCKKLAEDLERIPVRVDIDDRSDTLSRRIRDAEREWINYIVVFGEKEKEGVLSVRTRAKGEEQRKMKKDELIEELKKKTEGYPFERLPMAQMLSRRVIFRG